ncbi:HU domain-containing protein [Chryseobacterium oryctis]|uniref:CCDC81-like prokaryotic HU domain-containing protein n=1 Tax=Chryseobacterium oryctis TaxID=2952618 RepID=A0ABT3HMV2_9FLAO|nr:hypothetical protein [Chryseobacterium oryctis]MCW3160948.1 hypothetical protein [Chryseobacterium oryctis]
MNISAYILEYLKQFGTVTVPEFGVFSLENSKAIINSENGSILPPARKIAFVPDYEIQSDELISFIAEQKQMSFEASKSDLKIQTDFWKKKLQADQFLEIPNLGKIVIEDSEFHFNGNRIESGHPDFYGLEEIKISDIKNKEKSGMSEKPQQEYKLWKSFVWILLIILPVGVIAYLGITDPEVLFGKPSFQKEKDSIKAELSKPKVVEIDTIKLEMDSTMMKIADSLKKDSISKVPAISNKNTKNKWQK